MFSNYQKTTFDAILGHTSFIPHTGYAYHARDFFTRLNKNIPTRIRNFAHTPNLTHLTQEQKDMCIEQTWIGEPYKIGTPYTRDHNKSLLNIVLMESNHYYFFENYDGPKIAYNVWESTRQKEPFFNKLLEFDQLWVPTEWQKRVTIEQGYPEEKIRVVHEGVDFDIFNIVSEDKPNEYKDNRFKFIIFGRWDYRKYTTEMIKAFLEEFKSDEPIDLIVSIDNPFAVDNLKTTKERLKFYGFTDKRIKDIGFVSREDYVKYLKAGHVFLSCSRAEGWHLPLGEAIACGIPTICSSHGAQLEFAEGISHVVKTKEYRKPQNVFMSDDTPGEWDEPDFDDLKRVMRYVYKNYEECKEKALIGAEKIKENFKWEDAIKTAEGYISELYQKLYPPEIKLNIGCGTDKLNGYINADIIEGLGDIQMDATNLNCDDCSIDVLNSSHLLEHFGRRFISDILKEWYRVLKYNGKLILEVPNFEWCVNYWLQYEKEEFPLDTIFGNQHNMGEYHKTGFTKDSIIDFVNDAGFHIESIEDIWSHAQQCFKLVCTKRDIKFSDDVFILSTYPDEEFKLDILRNTISKLKLYNKPIAITTHYILPEDIINSVDYLIYDKNNPLSENWNLNQWFTVAKKLKIVTQYENKYHAVTVLTNMTNGITYLSNLYSYGHFIEYDIDVDLDKYLDVYGMQRNKNKKLVCFRYDVEQKYPPDKEKGVITNCLSFDLKYWNDLFSKYNIRNWSEYVKVDDDACEKLNQPNDYIFENWFYTFLKYNDCLKNTYIIPYNIKKDILFERSMLDQGKKELNVNIEVSKTNDDKAILFICNFKSDEEHQFIVRHIKDDVVVATGSDIVKKDDIKYLKFEREGLLEVVIVGTNIKKILDLTDDKIYKATFKFYDDKIICKNWQEINSKVFIKSSNKIEYTFSDKPRVEITGINECEYHVQFIDNDTGLIVHEGDIKHGGDIKSITWIACNRRYYTNWKIIVKNKTENITEEYIFNPENKSVYILLDSKSLGDTIAWFPYVEEFRKIHNCKVYVGTFHNHLFENNYPELNFIKIDTLSNFYATYIVGCRDNDYNSNKNNWMSIPLQQVSSDYLGLDYKEIKPNIVKIDTGRPIKEKYVCIAEHSTFQMKYWNNSAGWQVLVNYLNSLGYKVIVISKESTKLRSIIDKTNKSIEETINNIIHCEFFIGVSSGPAWLAWGLDKKVVIISGSTKEYVEMKDCIRIINRDVCNGCMNDINVTLDRGNWNFCPHNKKFECTRNIDIKMVITRIQKLLGI